MTQEEKYYEKLFTELWDNESITDEDILQAIDTLYLKEQRIELEEVKSNKKV